MKTFLGIDLGTSSLKVIQINEKTEVVGLSCRNMDSFVSNDGVCVEQSVENWWQKLLECINELDCSSVVSIGFSGHMHGLVSLDENLRPIYNAIMWNDKRSEKQASRISSLENKGCNRAVSGFLLSSLLWLKENENDIYKKVAYVMLPKDYLRFRLTGKILTDSGDASGTGAFNLIDNRWDYSLLQQLGISCEIFPSICNSFDVVGETISTKTTLPQGVAVVCGSGDHAMQLLGNGNFVGGKINCNIGTAAQLSVTRTKFEVDNTKLNVFCHAVDGFYNIVGASLNGGCVLKWIKHLLCSEMNYKEMDILASQAPPGSCGLIVLPYINGERNPILKSDLRMSFHEIGLEHENKHLIRSAMEGIIYNMRLIDDSLEDSTSAENKIVVSGGGARSNVMLAMIADILKKDVYVSSLNEQAAVGAAVLGGCGSGFLDFEKSQKQLESQLHLMAEPTSKNAIAYDDFYKAFKEKLAIIVN